MYNMKVAACFGLVILGGIACQKNAVKVEKKAELTNAAVEDGMILHTKPFNYSHESGINLSGVCFSYNAEAVKLNPEIAESGLIKGDCPDQVEIASFYEGQPAVAADVVRACDPYGKDGKTYGAITVYNVSYDLKNDNMYETSKAEAEKLCTDLIDIAALALQSN